VTTLLAERTNGLIVRVSSNVSHLITVVATYNASGFVSTKIRGVVCRPAILVVCRPATMSPFVLSASKVVTLEIIVNNILLKRHNAIMGVMPRKS
jgi:hypothetical protein